MRIVLVFVVALAVVVVWSTAVEATPDPDTLPLRPLDPVTADAATCLTNYGKTACGYHCVANYGDVQCARTAEGACIAAYGKVMCWDPAACHRERARSYTAECLANYGKLACGYGCVANYGEVRCSEVPGGVCVAAAGRITCSD